MAPGKRIVKAVSGNPTWLLLPFFNLLRLRPGPCILHSRRFPLLELQFGSVRLPLNDVNESPSTDPDPSRESTTRGPKMPPVLPEYNLGSRGAQRAVTYFDSEGRPRIASAREIAPPEDNPLKLPQRIGEWFAWTTSRGHRYWPLNVRSNVLSYYLIGKRRGGLSEALLGMVPWLPLLALDAAGLLYFYHRFELDLTMILLLASTFVVFPLMGAWAILMVQRHLSRIERLIPFDDLYLSRLEPAEVLYSLAIRPWSIQHFYNLIYSLSFLIAFPILGWQVAHFLAHYGESAALQIFSAPFIVLVALLRWFVASLAINLGVAYGLRARMFLSGRGRGLGAAMGHFFGQGLGFPLLAPVAAALLAYALLAWGACIFFLLAVPTISILYVVFKNISGRTWTIMRYTIRHSRDWVLLSGAEQREIPRYVKDVF